MRVLVRRTHDMVEQRGGPGKRGRWKMKATVLSDQVAALGWVSGVQMECSNPERISAPVFYCLLDFFGLREFAGCHLSH